MPTFEVFESDRDHENLIDSLQRILAKRKAQGFNLNSVTAHSFYNDPFSAAWQRRQGEAVGYSNPRQQISQPVKNIDVRTSTPERDFLSTKNGRNSVQKPSNSHQNFYLQNNLHYNEF